MAADVVILSDDVYPTETLRGLVTAFVGFCAGFHGRQDCAHIAAAGLDATCVDRDPERIAETRGLYPDRWEWVVADVYEYAAMRYAQGARFDIVSLDPYTNQFQECADWISLWTQMARVAVILGTGRKTKLNVPEGWKTTELIRRSSYQGGTFWRVLERST